jgi:hypothetical protein
VKLKVGTREEQAAKVMAGVQRSTMRIIHVLNRASPNNGSFQSSHSSIHGTIPLISTSPAPDNKGQHGGASHFLIKDIILTSV